MASRFWTTVALLALVVSLTATSSDTGDEVSCYSPCTRNNVPHCGSVLAGSGIRPSVAEIYFLNRGLLNLTCETNSIPRPTQITWQFRPAYETKWQQVKCSSMRTVKDCKINTHGEHRVWSNCLLRLDSLLHTGVYQCVASQPDDKYSITSGATDVKVYGVADFDAANQPESSTLRNGHVGVISVQVCADPKPTVVWVRDSDGKATIEGQTADGGYVALPLTDAVNMAAAVNQSRSPAVVRRFCYLAKLIVNKVKSADRRFTLSVSNSADTKSFKIRRHVLGSAASNIFFSPLLVVCCFLLGAFTTGPFRRVD